MREQAAEKKKVLDAQADAAIKAEQEEVEEEAAGDLDDPFAMMGGMGAEEVYEVKLLKEATPEEMEQAAEKKKVLDAQADAAIKVEQEEDESKHEVASSDKPAVLGATAKAE